MRDLKTLPTETKLKIFDSMAEVIKDLDQKREPWVKRYDDLKMQRNTTPSHTLSAEDQYVMDKADRMIVYLNDRAADELLERMLCWLLYT